MLKGKEVVSDPAKQAEIAKQAHELAHAGINKSTSVIAEQYHWNGIKSSVVLAIRNCAKCQGKHNGDAQSSGQSSDSHGLSNHHEQSVPHQSSTDGPQRQHPPEGYEAAENNEQKYDPNLTLDPRLTYNQ